MLLVPRPAVFGAGDRAGGVGFDVGAGRPSAGIGVGVGGFLAAKGFFYLGAEGHGGGVEGVEGKIAEHELGGDEGR